METANRHNYTVTTVKACRTADRQNKRERKQGENTMYKMTLKREGEKSFEIINKSLMFIMSKKPQDAEIIGLSYINGRTETKLF